MWFVHARLGEDKVSPTRKRVRAPKLGALNELQITILQMLFEMNRVQCLTCRGFNQFIGG